MCACFSEPAATILGGPDLYVDKGSTINLTCTIRFGPEPPGYIFWYHENKVSEPFFLCIFTLVGFSSLPLGLSFILISAFIYLVERVRIGRAKLKPPHSRLPFYRICTVCNNENTEIIIISIFLGHI